MAQLRTLPAILSSAMKNTARRFWRSGKPSRLLDSHTRALASSATSAQTRRSTLSPTHTDGRSRTEAVRRSVGSGRLPQAVLCHFDSSPFSWSHIPNPHCAAESPLAIPFMHVPQCPLRMKRHGCFSLADTTVDHPVRHRVPVSKVPRHIYLSWL